VDKPGESNLSSEKEPASDLLAAAVRSEDWRQVLRLWDGWVLVKSRILFHTCRDLFRGMDADDVYGSVRDRFEDRLVKIGYGDGCTNAEILARTRSFLFHSLQETKTAAIRRKGREVPLGEREPMDDKCKEGEESLKKQLTLVYLRTCIEELPSERQRQLIRLMLANMVLAQIASAWGESRQAVWNMFGRIKENLRHCIETKRGTP
jgi:hypothetical protein